MEERINDSEDRNTEIIRRGERTKFKKKMEETLQNPTKAMEFSQKGKYRNKWYTRRRTEGEGGIAYVKK